MIQLDALRMKWAASAWHHVKGWIWKPKFTLIGVRGPRIRHLCFSV